MNDIRQEAERAFYEGAGEADNPYDRLTQLDEHTAWREAHWEAWRNYKRRHKDWFGDSAPERSGP